MAASGETLKRRTRNIISNYIFEPFRVEKLGSWGTSARAMFKQVAKQIMIVFLHKLLEVMFVLLLK